MVLSQMLKDKVALVTGASRGIGRAIAESFCAGRREGGDLRPQGGHTGRSGARDRPGGHPDGLPCGAERADPVAWWTEATRELGRIDILVNNAATNVAQAPCLEIDEGMFDKMIEINLKSAFRLTQLVAPGMCERGSGSIINISSISGVRPQFEGLLYSMTKAALIMMTQSYALELGPKGVRVNAIAPGLIQTDLSAYYWQRRSAAREADWNSNQSGTWASLWRSPRSRCCWPATGRLL